MKKFFVTTIVALSIAFLASCSGGKLCKINGTLVEEGADGSKVYLYNYATSELLDSTTLNDSHFAFAGEYGNDVVLYINTEARYYGFCIAEAGEISIDLNTDAVSGTPMNDKLGEYNNSLHSALKDKEEALEALTMKAREMDQSDTVAMRQIFNEYETISKEIEGINKDLTTKLYESNKDNALGAFAFTRMLDSYTSFAELDAAVAQVNPAIAKYKAVQTQLEILRNIDATAVGKHYTDVNGLAMGSHDAITLSQLIDGKVAIVDFWASWCGPCRQEIKENLVPLYAKYASQGLQVVGLDISDKFEEHAKAVENLGITYPQLIDTTRVAATTYGVNSIPEIMLINKEGIIVARGLRGNAIEEAIKEALK